MTNTKLKELKILSFRVREHIISLSKNGGCFIGASLSCTDILVYLYREYLNINFNNLKNPGGDYFFLSKGHDVPALYGLFVELGFLEKSRLANHLKTNDFIYWHPNIMIPGIEFHSGSLGHLISIAMGVAFDCKARNPKNKVIVMLGDGELNEGSIWEAALVASSYKLDNLIVIVDRNKFQANIETEKLIKLEPLVDKFKTFGWSVRTMNGHNFTDIADTFTHLPIKSGKPVIVIADTVRGKGLPSIEAKADRWFANFTNKEVELLLKELKTRDLAKLNSETIIAR